MRTDIKVGMAIAVILIGIGVAWFVFFRSGEPVDKTPGAGDATVSGETNGTNRVITDPPVTLETTLPPTPTEPFIRPPYTPPSETTVPAVADDHTAEKTDEWDGVPVRSALAATESTVPAIRTYDVTGRGRTYVIKEGDSYWIIAHNLWGDGSLYSHLQKANPGVSPEDLRPRMTIKVPPKPVRAGPSSSAVATVRHGTTSVDLLTGKRYYIVKKGDRGFWDISKAVYGNGKHYGLIEKANPRLDTRKLRAGQKVWCPDKPVTVRPAGAAVTPAGTEPAYVRPTTTAPAASVAGGDGAPTRTTLPDGRIFD